MLRIHEEILDWLEELVSLLEEIGRRDSDLGRQLRRASRSVALNTAEGMVASGGDRRRCYGIALREARESLAVLEVSERLGYCVVPSRFLRSSS